MSDPDHLPPRPAFGNTAMGVLLGLAAFLIAIAFLVITIALLNPR